MSWVRFDDNYRNHPKIVFAGKDGRELHTALVFYCARELTDGLIHVNQIEAIAAQEKMKNWKALLGRLTVVIPNHDHPLLLGREMGFYELHDYLRYQPSKAKVLAERDAAKERMRSARGGKQPADSTRSSGVVRPEQSPNFGANIDRSSTAPDSRFPNLDKNQGIPPPYPPLSDGGIYMAKVKEQAAKDALMVFIDEYKNIHDGRPPALTPAQHTAIRNRGSGWSEETFREAIRAFYSSTDGFVVDKGYHIGIFTNNEVMRWINAANKNPQPIYGDDRPFVSAGAEVFPDLPMGAGDQGFRSRQNTRLGVKEWLIQDVWTTCHPSRMAGSGWVIFGGELPDQPVNLNGPPKHLSRLHRVEAVA